MAVDVTALAELVSGNIYRGMQSRAQRRQQEEQERANREAEMARETQLRQANARMAQDQIESMNRQEYQRASLDLSRAAGARAEREMGLRTEESARREQERRDELAFLKADTIDLLNQAGELTPDREGRIWATDSVGALNEMRSRFEKAYSEGRSAAKEIENLRKTGKDLKDAGLLKQLVKPDGTPDKDKQALFSTWLDDPTVDRISMIRQASGQARTLREQAAAEQAAIAAGPSVGIPEDQMRATVAMRGAGIPFTPRVPEPMDPRAFARSGISDRKLALDALEAQWKPYINPLTGGPAKGAKESAGVDTGWAWFDGDPSPEYVAAQKAFAQWRQMQSEQAGAATGLVSGTAAANPVVQTAQQIMADFQQRNGRMPTREEWAAMRPQMQGPPR